MGKRLLQSVIMKTLIGALTVGTILDGVSALAADAQHLRQPKHDAPERLRMIRECMGMHHKHGGDMPFHSGGNERLYRACMATRPPWIKTRKLARNGSLPEHGRAMCEQHARDPYNWSWL